MQGKQKKLTDFQWRVLAAAMAIPLGETRSYTWVAQKIGCPRAARAVGQALKNNPYPLIIPCHRVIREDGSPGGYAGRQTPKKAKLLAMEKKIAFVIGKSSPLLLNSNRAHSTMKKNDSRQGKGLWI
jgi:O-6-methylguanine DNA methyltransferase